MATGIVFISPYEDLSERIRCIVNETNEAIEVYTAYLEEAFELCKKLEKEGTEVLISRGGNTKYLREVTAMPVVDMAHNLADYMDALERAKETKGVIGLFSYQRRIAYMDTVAKLIEADIRQYIFESRTDLSAVMDGAIADGMVLGIGGVVSQYECEARGIEYIRVVSSRDAIVNAIKSAKEVYRIQREEKEKSAKYRIQMENHKAVVDFSYNGIIGLDKNLTVNVYNTWAEKILEIKREHIIGKHIFDVLPETQLIKVMETGTAEFDVFKKVNGKQIIINRIPIFINDEVQGVVATFQDVKTIQESERKIRRNLAGKGLVAKYAFSDIQTDSPAMQQCIDIAKGYAKSASTVLIYGESGTGKELFAQSIHHASPRRNQPFVAINCAALPATILESELFGYEEGTFTGAKKGGKVGLFELAHEGTIFLDEIAEIPLTLQAQLLRVLQEKQIRRLGSDKIIPIDVRVITATNKDLAVAVNEGCFREDLFYRINILRLSIPPLRDRREDIVKIGNYLIKTNDYKLYIDNQEKWDAIFELLEGYHFHGNVRELQNIIERTMVVLKENIYDFENYKQLLGDILNIENVNLKRKLSEHSIQEKQRILEALNEANWSKTKASERLGLSRSTLWRKMKSYDIDS
ncbi:sigma 54-interacting transcriptional regulator [Fusibacter paucivorans]|uniref:Sigma 54-interacting transcriptional regulator n=1 Tax=Fusibacter paucivorans TaxID=76009 RepID=A0ABS5PND3_9FIRM|nr:sigma 54-interacting transcriptional regulator [Fusibacter paucivorans]MBS7526081.1 sigma 54-interacting transcriptional regulator [Fusibacter paucivorans]